MSLQCNIEKIIKKTEWIYDEISVRRELLSAGRSIAGTHFIIIDADEMFSANCLDQNYLRREILALNPGEALSLPLVNLWKSIHFYAPSLVSNIHTIFCDDGSVNYKKPEKSLSIKIHIPRIPSDYFKIKYLSEPNCILVHFRFTNWRDSIIKKIWYMCFELINNDLDKSNFEISEMINNRYGKTFFNDSELDKTILCTNPLWFTYSFFDSAIALKDTQEWRKSCILHWFNTYGKDYFKNLAIWELDIYNI